MSKKIEVSVQDGTGFSLLIEGKIVKIIIETTEGVYETNSTFTPNKPKRKVGVKAEMERYSGMAEIDDILEHYK